MDSKTVKKVLSKPERVTRLSTGYSISKRAPLNHVEINKINESIIKSKSVKFSNRQKGSFPPI